MLRRLILCTALAAATAPLTLSAAEPTADSYPHNPIRMVIPFPPGGGTDILSRVVANALTQSTGWTIVPENKAGAGGTIGITDVAKASPNGYEMVMGQKDNLVLGPYLYKNLPWDPLKDLTPVAHIAYTPVLIATSVDKPYQSIQDVMAAAKAQPDQITYGSPGNGTSIHIAAHLFEKAAGISLVHVPYKGSNPALMDAIAGNVDLLVSSIPSAMAQIKAGKLRPLAVTSAKRSSSLPDVPTMQEAGMPGFDVSTWYGLFMPAGSPAYAVQKINAQVNALLQQPKLRAAIQAQGAEPLALSVSDFEQLYRSDFTAAKAVVQSSGATLQ